MNVRYHGDPINVEVDKRDLGGGVKNWEWIKKGVPIRIEIGPRDLAQGTAAVSRRDKPHKEKSFLPVAELLEQFPGMLGRHSVRHAGPGDGISRQPHAASSRAKKNSTSSLHREMPQNPKFMAGLLLPIGMAALSLKRKSRIS